MSSKSGLSSSHSAKYYTTQVGYTTFRIDTRYQNLFRQGDGSYYCVASAFDTLMNRTVAIKKIRSPLSELSHLKRILREVILLRHFITHENIVSIYDIMTDPPDVPDFEDIYIVTNLFETDMEKIISSNENSLTDHHLQFFMYQILRGLKFIHSANVIHRDLKPANLLVNSSCDLAICDFGWGRGLNSIYENPLTQYVVTRYYRAPELLCEASYGKPIDVWSVGCIFAEMITRAPFFKGENPQEQLRSIIHKVGCPPRDKLSFVKSKAALGMLLSNQSNDVPHFAMNFPNGTSFLALDLIRQMLEFNPNDRITVEDALKHPYLKNFHDLVSEPVCQNIFNFSFENSSSNSSASETNRQQPSKKSRSNASLSEAELAIGETLARTFMTSVFGKNVSPTIAAGVPVVSPRFTSGDATNRYGHNYYSNSNSPGQSTATASSATDHETIESTSNEYDRMRKLTKDQISIREAKFLILQEVKIYRQLSPAIISFLAQESNMQSQAQSNVESQSNMGSISSKGHNAITSRSASDLYHVNSANIVSPRPQIGDYSTGRGQQVRRSSSSSAAVSMSMSVPSTPREITTSSDNCASNNFFATQYANPINNRSASGNISYSGNVYKNYQQPYSANNDGYSNMNANGSVDTRHLDIKSSSSGNAFTNNRGSSSNGANSNAGIANPTLNNYNSFAAGPAPVCEDFQWLSNGDEEHDDNNNEVDLLFGVSYISQYLLLVT